MKNASMRINVSFIVIYRSKRKCIEESQFLKLLEFICSPLSGLMEAATIALSNGGFAEPTPRGLWSEQFL
ncbi:hypothetical protein C5167_031736 [Papaver somniferum]|uniref:Uncharacterized protein n=1 Tax=Papaver somniferum TaxID=3469 RepID=A0A4Y7K7S1_PAPSO|nr:hypothetical protein C5167_031736 [Papaver somniferum]